jgi:hypothetical protein
MTPDLYNAIINHLSDQFNINNTKLSVDVPNISLDTRSSINTTELLVKDRKFYLTGDKISIGICKLDDNIVITQQIGYLNDNKIYIKKN